MNCRRLISSIIWAIYLLTTQLVVHAFAMHDMSMMQGMDHGVVVAQDCVHDHSTHHMQDDLSISSSPMSHDMTDCITITKTASKTNTTQLIVHTVADIIVYLPAHSTQILPRQTTITVADYQPPGWSEFLDNHYGHGVVMIS